MYFRFCKRKFEKKSFTAEDAEKMKRRRKMGFRKKCGRFGPGVLTRS
jgi:hypothetical protein